MCKPFLSQFSVLWATSWVPGWDEKPLVLSTVKIQSKKQFLNNSIAKIFKRQERNQRHRKNKYLAEHRWQSWSWIPAYTGLLTQKPRGTVMVSARVSEQSEWDVQGSICISSSKSHLMLKSRRMCLEEPQHLLLVRSRQKFAAWQWKMLFY